jgi:uncharacterized SAM-binding protein YcdF (DUF218 family)
MSLLLDWVTQPVGLISLLLVSTLLSRRRKYPSQWLPASTPGIAVGLFWLFSTPVFANSVVYLIENWRQYPELCDTQHDSRPLVVLGGGLDSYRQSTSAYELLDRDTQLRVSRALEAATADSHFFLLGGGKPDRTLAKLMAALMHDRGIAASRITTESSSHSTVANASALRRLLPVEFTPAISLVTSALHIPRAAAVFERHGYVVCHIAADTQYTKAVFPVSLLPYISALNKSTLVMRELLAWTLYIIRDYV